MSRQSDAGKEEKEVSQPFTITLENVRDYEFVVKFDKEQYADLALDEGPPLGGDSAPNASRLLAAAVGNCLSASLLFCARKSRLAIAGLRTSVTVNYTRNERGRVRIGAVDVTIETRPEGPPTPEKLQRCMELFEDYCVVTESVRQGIEVSVTVSGHA